MNRNKWNPDQMSTQINIGSNLSNYTTRLV